MYKCTKPITTNDDLRFLHRKILIGAQWLFTRTGPLAIGINQGGLFTRALPESTTPDVQFHFATLSAELAGAKPHPWPGFTMSVCQLRPESRGTVRIRSADPLEAPSMQPNYLSAELDRRCAVAGVRLARSLAATESLQPYVAEEYRPGAQAQTRRRPARIRAQLRRDHLPSLGHLQDGRRSDGGGGRPRCACTAWPACAWWTARSCRRSCRATRTRRW